MDRTRPQASRTQPSIAAQDDYVKQPQMQKPLEPEELQELEDLIGSLSTDQLEELQAIMDRDHDEVTEFDLISGELAEMGVEEEDIADLKLLGSMMHKFLVQVPDIETRLEMKKPHDLMDHTTYSCTCWAFPTSWDPLVSWLSTAFSPRRRRRTLPRSTRCN